MHTVHSESPQRWQSPHKLGEQEQVPALRDRQISILHRLPETRHGASAQEAGREGSRTRLSGG